VLRGADLGGTIAIVTGGYSGVGLETTRALAEPGAMVVVPASSAEKARTAVNRIARVELDQMGSSSVATHSRR
jgi:NAD(P)-dependent dehydrogenase (short-subunit alcohol dehydrogenase family)